MKYLQNEITQRWRDTRLRLTANMEKEKKQILIFLVTFGKNAGLPEKTSEKGLKDFSKRTDSDRKAYESGGIKFMPPM